jgi:tetratricopeptide (TPR) repeat protein
LAATYSGTPLAEQAAYRSGFTAFGKGDYGQAIEKLSAALQSYPANPLRGEAQFFIGESFYKQGEYDKAIKAYQLIASLPGNEYADDAQYSLAWAFIGLNNPQKALLGFGKVIETSDNPELIASALFQPAGSCVNPASWIARATRFIAPIPTTRTARMRPMHCTKPHRWHFRKTICRSAEAL